MKLFSSKNAHSGFSLVEAMVGMAIAAGIGLVLMRQQESSSKMQAKNDANQVVNSAVNVVQSAISNRAVCSLSLKGLKSGDPVPALVDAVVNPADFTSFIATGKPNHVTAGQDLQDGVKVQEMRIVTENGKDYLSVVFNLNPTGRKKMFGSDVVGRKFQLQGVKDGANKYTSCHSELSNLVATACTTMPGGVWDPATQKCKLSGLPACIITPNACSGMYSQQSSSYQMQENYDIMQRKCHSHYKNMFKSFDRDCYCDGAGCSCDTGQVDGYHRTTMNECSDVGMHTLQRTVTTYKCCQP